jgi:hypothetical protein
MATNFAPVAATPAAAMYVVIYGIPYVSCCMYMLLHHLLLQHRLRYGAYGNLAIASHHVSVCVVHRDKKEVPWPDTFPDLPVIFLFGTPSVTHVGCGYPVCSVYADCYCFCGFHSGKLKCEALAVLLSHLMTCMPIAVAVAVAVVVSIQGMGPKIRWPTCCGITLCCMSHMPFMLAALAVVASMQGLSLSIKF